MDFEQLKTFLHQKKYPEKYPTVYSIDKTIEEILKGKSISRFGDGEYSLILGFDINLQKNNLKLNKKLIRIASNKNKNCLIATTSYESSVKTFYGAHFFYENLDLILYYFKNSFFDASITRRSSLNQLNKLKQAWNKKHVIFVTGKGSRFDVKHELFDNISSYEELYSLPVNAWQDYANLKTKIIASSKRQPNAITLIALGPTATVLAYELSDYLQTLDIGHMTNHYDQQKYQKPSPESLPEIAIHKTYQNK